METEISDARILEALLRDDFCAFIERVFSTVSPGDRYVPGWHIEAIAHELCRCASGETTRLLITQPPRSLKSICASVAFPAWVLGHDPTLWVICASYAQDLASELARQFRRVIDSDWYQRLFPGLRLARDSGAECVTTSGGGRLATSVGGTLTGRGADIIIIDDPMKADDAASEVARRRVIDWYRGTLVTRPDNKDSGVIVLVMQRLHQDDLAGHVTSNGTWRHLDLPAIALDEQEIEIGWGRSHHRPKGTVLQPDREDQAILNRLREELGSIRFSAQYLQRPVPAQGNLLQREWLKTYDVVPTGAGVQIVQSWDLATTSSSSSDYSVCVTSAVDRGRHHLIDVHRRQLSYPDLKRTIRAHAEKWRPATILIERAGPGLTLCQEFDHERPDGMVRPIGIRPSGDKVLRFESSLALVERGDLLIPTDAPWLGLFLEELLGFPNTRHDDQVDAVSQLLNWSSTRRHYRQVFTPGLSGRIFYLEG